ncbi:vomeronasal type-2 receptor 1-like [Lithobates pipiens]
MEAPYYSGDFAGSCVSVNLEEYKNILTLIFAVNEINKDPDLLPNVTLGYRIFDTCGDPKKTLGYVLQILSGKKMEAPNYSCRGHGEVAGFIGDSNFYTSHAMAHLLSRYQYTQLNYQVTNPLMSDRSMFPTLYRMIPDDRICYKAVLKCLLHFGWTWVGIVTPNDGSGDTEVQELRKMMARHGICIEYVIKFSDKFRTLNKQETRVIRRSTSKIVIVCGFFSEYFLHFFTELHNEQKVNLTFIFHEPWKYLKSLDNFHQKIVNCSLIFLQPLITFSAIEEFVNDHILSTSPNDPIREPFWLQMLYMFSSIPRKKGQFRKFIQVNYTDLDRFKPILYGIKDSKPVYVFRAVYILAFALEYMDLVKGKSGSYGLEHIGKLHRYIRKVHYVEPSEEEIYINERGEVPSEQILGNLIYIKSNHHQILSNVSIKPLAKFRDYPELDRLLNIKPEDIIWKRGTVSILLLTVAATFYI